MTIPREMYSSLHAGETYYQQLIQRAEREAQSMTNFFAQVAITYRAKQVVPELEAMQAELEDKCNTFGKQIAELDKKINSGKARNVQELVRERNNVSSEYQRERAALSQVNIVLGSIATLDKPMASPWLREWVAECVTDSNGE